MYTIYAIRNLENGKIYVGSTIDIQTRLSQHISSLRNGKHANVDLQKDYDAGNNSLEFYEIESGISKESRIEKECAYMVRLKTYDSRFGYNTRDKQLKKYMAGQIKVIKGIPPTLEQKKDEVKANKKKLELAMANACMNTKDLQAVSQIPRPTLNGAISGRGVSPATLGRIARALGVPVEQIIEQEE